MTLERLYRGAHDACDFEASFVSKNAMSMKP